MLEGGKVGRSKVSQPAVGLFLLTFALLLCNPVNPVNPVFLSDFR